MFDLLHKDSRNDLENYFDQTSSPVLDIIAFRYLLALAVDFKLEIFLMDVVTAYLYGNLDMLLYISPPPNF
jgi:hypothetical protein